MKDTELIQTALMLTPPWQVAECQFDINQERLNIHLDFLKGSQFSCPACDQADCAVHDTKEKSWRHLNFFQHETYMTARVPRIKCSNCGVRLINVPWARAGSEFTLLFEAYIMILAPSMHVNLKTMRAYQIRLNFQELWLQPPEQAEAFLNKWYFWATHSRIEPVKEAAYTIKRHWDGVLNWFKSMINNGILEGFNSLVQAAKARARGYRTTEYLIPMIYLITGKLRFNLPS